MLSIRFIWIHKILYKMGNVEWIVVQLDLQAYGVLKYSINGPYYIEHFVMITATSNGQARNTTTSAKHSTKLGQLSPILKYNKNW